MVALLKQKSKIITDRKPRKTYEVKPIFKRKKEMEKVIDSSYNELNKTFNFDKKPDPKRKIVPTVTEKLDT